MVYKAEMAYWLKQVTVQMLYCHWDDPLVSYVTTHMLVKPLSSDLATFKAVKARFWP